MIWCLKWKQKLVFLNINIRTFTKPATSKISDLQKNNTKLLIKKGAVSFETAPLISQ
jgi:hypothetical protein